MSKLNEKLLFLTVSIFYYMKLGLSEGPFCQISLQDTIGVPDMVKDHLCSYQTKLEVLQCYRTITGNTYI